MNDSIQLKEWPQFDDAYVLGQKFTGRVICQNTRTESEISLSFRAVEILDARETTSGSTSKRRRVIFQSVQRASRHHAALETRDRVEWWFEIKTPTLCDKSYNLPELGLQPDDRFAGEVQCILPPSLPAKSGATVEYEFQLDISRAAPHNQRVLKCILPFVQPPTLSSPPAAGTYEVTLAKDFRARGRSTLESQFRILLPDDPELQVPSRNFNVSLHVPNSITPGQPADFLISVKELNLSSETGEDAKRSFKVAQLKLELRSTTTYRLKAGDGAVETKTVRGSFKRFTWQPEHAVELPNDGEPAAIQGALTIPKSSKEPSFIPGFRTLDVHHSHEFRADVYIQHIETDHYYSMNNDGTFPIVVVPPSDLEEQKITNGHVSEPNPVSGNASQKERTLPLVDETPAPRIIERVSTYGISPPREPSRWQKRFSFPRLNSWRRSSDALSQISRASTSDETSSRV